MREKNENELKRLQLHSLDALRACDDEMGSDGSPYVSVVGIRPL